MATAQAARGPSNLAVFLIVPVTIISLLGFVAPVINLLTISFQQAQSTGALVSGFTLATWHEVLTDPFYRELVVNSVVTSLLITFLVLVLSYPIALYLHRCRGLRRTVILVLVISPLLLSAVVRTYGWIAILSDGGLINRILAVGSLGPVRLIYNMAGVVIGLTEILMPYMVLALLAGFGRLDRRAEEAAATLGARPWTVFRRIILPLSLPGILLGCLLCFVLAISSFITPKLLGGGRVFLLATEIYDQAIVTLNWPVAAALSGVILLIFGGALVSYTRLVSKLV